MLVLVNLKATVPDAWNRARARRLASPTRHPIASSMTFKELKEEAEGGNPEAQRGLGIFYSTGDGVEQDYAEALKWYREAAKHGDAGAECLLGLAYANGLGVDKDETEAVKWYRKSAEKGEKEGQLQLGLSLCKGEGVAEDSTEGIHWLKSAAEQGDSFAQHNVAVCYYGGKGVAKDLMEAYAWWAVASLTDAFSANLRDKLEEMMTPHQASAARKRAKELREQLEAGEGPKNEFDQCQTRENAKKSRGEIFGTN